MSETSPNWLATGEGDGPSLGWSFTADAPLVGLELARETGETLVADESGRLYRLDRSGRVTSLTRAFQSLGALAWSDAGQHGVAVVDNSRLNWLDRKLTVRWSIDLREPILAVAIDSHGHYVAAALVNGETIVFNARKKQVGEYETIRPLGFLQFVTTEPAILGAAEYGLLCCHQLDGVELWNERMWSNVGDLSVTGNGQTIFLARFNQGIQLLDRDGENRGSYLVRGTPNHVSTSFMSRRLGVSTMEREFYWLDAEGELLWAANLPDDVSRLQTGPLGRSILCGFQSGRIDRLEFQKARAG